ncbi:hypothetical protein O1L60_26365 [Streptomyces diastatochromogenes]|nr:hypothetical protein [Streptomyces diastatochromogenes]
MVPLLLPQAHRVSDSWPGWTVEFWHDNWQRHTAADHRFSPATFDPRESTATVLAEAEERRAARARHHAQVASLRTTPAPDRP